MAAPTGHSSKWLQSLQDSPKPLEAPAVLESPTGPGRPQRGVRRQPDTGVPRVLVSGPAPALWVMGAHGGAGESTLTALLHGAAATDHGWPVRDGAGGTDHVLLVCRSHAAGLRAAQLAAIEYGSDALPGTLAGLVVLADAPGRLPKVLQDQIRLVAGAVPHTWQLPWVEEWRRSLTPDVTAVPGAVRNVLEKIQLQIAAGNH